MLFSFNYFSYFLDPTYKLDNVERFNSCHHVMLTDEPLSIFTS